MIRAPFCFYFVLSVLFFAVNCQEYDFAAEISRQCLVPDPVGLLDCVENKVTLPYLTSWVDCTNSLGQNVRTSTDIINYRCKSVWEGKGVIPEVFYIKDCVIEKTGLPAKNVSAEVLGAYKECESSPSPPPSGIKTAPIQQQQLRTSNVQYQPPVPQLQLPVPPPQQTIQVQKPIQQIQAPVFRPSPPTAQFQIPIQQIQTPIFRQPQPQVQRPVTQFQAPITKPQQSFQMQIPLQQNSFQHSQMPASFQTHNAASGPQFGSPVTRQFQPQPPPRMQQQPIQPQMLAPNPVQQVPIRTFRPIQQTHARPAQQPITAAFRPQYPSPISKPQYITSVNPSAQHQPFSQQFFTIYPQAPLSNQQQNVNRASLSQKTVPFVSQQLVSASTQGSSAVLNAPFSYSYQVHHPLQPTF